MKGCFMKKTGTLDPHRTISATVILETMARNLRSAMGRRPPTVNIFLIVAAATLCLSVALYFAATRAAAERPNHDWPHHGNDLANTRFQDLDQISPSNVNKLQVAWVFHTGVLDPLAEMVASPSEVDGRL